ncbi:flagellar basal body P-ring formation chaperone FlgA [Burkholderia pseudomallei]|uniref:flagellar basal body P-ring formation chaperone FlgA n=1 Tax=Burkholderia pseudomallei TaxID=28450 RepID=UPI0003452043|nr:flagellar basal body P-ring formation chaperone FlgA [Burkholderia pseudomallei]AIP04763.1 flagella basal body P-ring formation protein FlgA [Burkholderia pseudomallei]AUG22629.1 flagella basal body P-ring formation protein FlgA [Burkholderia pseudomallei]KGU60945.1 flagella basal body P-ring formation protein FlgA [Burkholderia pseudomallei MSHR543]KGX21395.1 flagella basal body P-ring formation protein FlgA [Burkholderia pseudomallei]KGX27988.1 flagella basal body P-ring formation protein
MTTDAGRATRTRFAVALALAGWMGAALAQQAGDGGMIVIPGRGESAQTALANANAASARGANGAGAAGPGGADRTASSGGWHAPAAAQAAAAWSGRVGAASGAESAAESGDVRAATEPRTGLIVIEPGPAESNGRIPAAAPSGWPPSAAMPRAESNGDANPVPPRTGSNRSAGSTSASAGWTAPPGAASQGNPAANVAPAPRVSAASRAPATTDMQRVAPVIAQDEGAAPAGRPANARAAAQSWPARGPSAAAGGVIPVSLRAQPAPRTLPVRSAPIRAAATSAAGAQPAAASATAAGAVPAGQQDGESIRRAALAFLQQQAAGLPGKTTVTVAPAFPRGLAACTTLEPFLPSGARLWGRTTVGVRCAGERPWTIYLQAKLAVQATYYVAARQIAPGETLTAADLVARDGDLTLLPLAVITDAQQAVGATALMRVAAGLPLRQDLLKSAASVSIGQTVRVVASGQGFTISAEGSVLNNAAPGQQVRVRMAAGQIVTAIVKDAATVEIPL